MREITLELKVGFRTDAILTLFYRLNGNLYSINRSSAAASGGSDENYFNNRYETNLTPTTHVFVISIPDNSIIDSSVSLVKFGYLDKRSYDCFAGPGVLKTLYLNQLNINIS